MLDVNKMIESAKEALGWPYVSPGSNDRNGIDCSGLFVKIFRDQGAKIYHGSNTIFHDYCSKTEKLTSANQLHPGMAVFKLKAWTDADKGNKWYGHEPGNLSHIGLVVSGGSNLQIIHASSAGSVRYDTNLSKWQYCGYLKNVDYSGSVDPEPSPEPEPTPTPTPDPKIQYATVWSANGKPVNTRKGPDETYDLSKAGKVKVGSIVELIEEKTNKQGEDWWKVKYIAPDGVKWICWIKGDFLHFDNVVTEPSDDGDIDEDLDGSPVGDLVTIVIQGLTEAEADALMKKYPNSMRMVG